MDIIHSTNLTSEVFPFCGFQNFIPFRFNHLSEKLYPIRIQYNWLNLFFLGSIVLATFTGLNHHQSYNLILQQTGKFFDVRINHLSFMISKFFDIQFSTFTAVEYITDTVIDKALSSNQRYKILKCWILIIVSFILCWLVIIFFEACMAIFAIPHSCFLWLHKHIYIERNIKQ